ncbi:MAG: universal stress protein [Lysobacterales bacterium]
MTSSILHLPEHDGERHEERDDIERLIAVSQHFGAAMFAELPRIVVAIDGTEVSLALADQIVRWQQVYRWPCAVHLLWIHPFVGKEAADRQLEANGIEQTAASCDRLKAAGLAFTRHLVMGNPAGCIVRRSMELKASMILMGTRGHGPLGSALLGSVANRVTQEAEIPVTLVRA